MFLCCSVIEVLDFMAQAEFLQVIEKCFSTSYSACAWNIKLDAWTQHCLSLIDLCNSSDSYMCRMCSQYDAGANVASQAMG